MIYGVNGWFTITYSSYAVCLFRRPIHIDLSSQLGKANMLVCHVRCQNKTHHWIAPIRCKLLITEWSSQSAPAVHCFGTISVLKPFYLEKCSRIGSVFFVAYKQCFVCFFINSIPLFYRWRLQQLQLLYVSEKIWSRCKLIASCTVSTQAEHIQGNYE